MKDEDIVEGYEIVATLDYNTCHKCGERDGLLIPLSAPELLPPFHQGCRCTYVKKLKSPESLGIPAIRMNRMRASVNGPVPQSLKWREWIKLFPEK